MSNHAVAQSERTFHHQTQTQRRRFVLSIFQKIWEIPLMLFSWIKRHAAPKHLDAETTNPDWRNELATEQQKEKLRFVGCTWDGDITAGQAEAALEECAKQFPHVEAAHRNYQYQKAVPASESQKDKLRFFGCTWNGDITVEQAKNSLEQCSKLFPQAEAAYLRREYEKRILEFPKIKLVESLLFRMMSSAISPRASPPLALFGMPSLAIHHYQ